MNQYLLIGLTLAAVANLASSACSDDGSNCRQFSGMCHNAVYESILLQYCKSTCDNCPGVCKDNSPRCPSWNRNGFCQSAYYTSAHKELYCAKTCGLCKDGGDSDGDGSGSGGR
ncbi:unnamed protein product [Bursaphelenchus xylophilus]|uniref:(pine wood nematode) hypothetical protein n=1 Tax=Bursaphelenchus xylophilus TaxID=6326 RepID=A0A1I7S2R2_BURXY|nr:unnamed protein product [Bursaphelenchus xylophilus]CAG9121704.1 unnamed protein product [Bursaphelenchus xylophilus]